MEDFTWLDYIIFLTFFTSLIMGLARGLLRELISLGVILVALVVTIKFTMSLMYFLYYTRGSHAVIFFMLRFIHAEWSHYIGLFTLDLSVLLLFVGTMSVGEAVNYYVFPNTFTTTVLSLLFRLSGAAIGLIRGYIFNVILVLVLSITPIIDDPAWLKSSLVPRLMVQATVLGNKIEPHGFGTFADTRI